MTTYPRSRGSRYSDIFVGAFDPKGVPSGARHYQVLSAVDRQDGTVTPNFRTIINSRKKKRPNILGRRPALDLPCNDFANDKFNATISPARWRALKLPYGVYDFYGAVYPNRSLMYNRILESDWTPIENAALSKAGERINGTQFNIPLFVKDFETSCNMIANAARDIYSKMRSFPSLAALIRDNIYSKEGFNKWLEYRYGWRLLLKDAYDAMCAVYDARNKGVTYKVSLQTFSVQKLGEIRSYNNGDYWGGSAGPQCDVLITGTQKLSVKYTLWLRDSIFANKGTSLGQQFGITNPMALIWDAIPYSFVVDWFIPVGDFLTSMDGFLGKDFVKGCKSRLYEEESDWLAVNPRYTVSMNKTVSSPVTPSHLQARFFRRSRLLGLPSASLPTVDINLNPSRALDAIALLRQRF